MVNESGQLYTIEGIAAAFLMIFTTYIVLSSTTILTPADTHVIDMQLEQLGNDALAMMDTPDPSYQTSKLEDYIQDWDNGAFQNDFNSSVNHDCGGRPLDFNAYVYYRDDSGKIQKGTFFESPHMAATKRFVAAHPVTVTRWVYVEWDPNNPPLFFTKIANPHEANQVVLLEVTLWRD